MDCEKIHELLSEYIDGRLSVEESAAVAAHLEDCAECREFEKELRATVRLVGDLEHRTAPEGFVDGVAAALERKMLLDGPLAPRGRRRWVPWSFAGLSVAAAAAVLAIALVGGPPQQTPMSQAEPAAPGVSVAMHEDEIREDILDGEVASERAAALKVNGEREELSDPRLRVDKGATAADDAASDVFRFHLSRRVTEGDAGHFSWKLLEVPDSAVEPPLKRRLRAEAAGESRAVGAGGAGTLAYGARVSDLADKDEKTLGGDLEVDTAKAGPPVAVAADEAALRNMGYVSGAEGGGDTTAAPAETEGVEQAAISPVEVADAPGAKLKKALAIPQIEFHSQESALEATALFANNFLAPKSQMALAESTPEELKKRLAELRFQVIEMSEARTVLQMDMEPIAVLYNNEMLIQNTSLSQAGVTPREITSQVSLGNQMAIANQAPITPGAPGKPLAVQYVFIQRLPREKADATHQEPPAQE